MTKLPTWDETTIVYYGSLQRSTCKSYFVQYGVHASAKRQAEKAADRIICLNKRFLIWSNHAWTHSINTHLDMITEQTDWPWQFERQISLEPTGPELIWHCPQTVMVKSISWKHYIEADLMVHELKNWQIISKTVTAEKTCKVEKKPAAMRKIGAYCTHGRNSKWTWFLKIFFHSDCNNNQ